MSAVLYFFYRKLMRLAHKFNWHYAPQIGPFEDGSVQLWCKWCGFRETYNYRPGAKQSLSDSQKERA